MAGGGPEVNTKGSSRTTCTVIVDTHDRGVKLKGQRIDLSPYITQVSVDTHLTGGGQASINLPAIQHIEDVIAAGDLINIYFNLHRDDVDQYNKGNVRTFFGYIDTVNKSVSVDGSGAKLTSYNLTCLAFDKAIKATEIYNNPNLVSRADNTKHDVVRNDFKNNLGGLSLLTKGIATRGTPRDLTIRNLMRLLGFGGQFVLPAHYEEMLPDAVRAVNFKEPKVAGKLIFSKHAMAAITKDQQIAILDKLKELKGLALTPKELNLTTQLLKGHITLDSLIQGVRQDKYPPLMEAFLQLVAELAPNTKSRMTLYMPVFSDSPTFETAFISNTYFKVSTGLTNQTPIGISTKTDVETGVKRVLERQLQETYYELRSYTGDKAPNMFPSINMWADESGEETRAKTLFNILSLDYMEDVEGYYGNFNYMHFSGTLWAALYQNSNADINELFFDLRPAANFAAAQKDGLGIDIDGAIPMVPAVILREKPFTNYRQPTRVLESPDNTSTIKIGAISGTEGGTVLPMGDQLYMSVLADTGATRGFRGLSAADANIGKVMGSLESIGIGTTTQEVSPIEFYNLSKSSWVSETLNNNYSIIGSSIRSLMGSYEFPFAVGGYTNLVNPLLNIPGTVGTIKQVTSFKESAEKELSGLEVLTKNFLGINLESDQFVTSGASAKQIKILSLTPTAGAIDEVPTKIAERAFSTIFSLPRPVFRSPDGGRVTIEKKMGGVQRILGVLQPTNNPAYGEPYKMHFFAFGTNAATAATVKNLTGESIYGKSRETASDLNAGANLLLSPDSLMSELQSGISKSDEQRAHILEFLKIHSQDVMNESFSRGDHGILNLIQLLPQLGVKGQKLYFNDQLPIITPISIHRFGVRVMAHTTNFVNPALLGLANDFWNQKSMILKWNVLLDMWNQHNHELLSGSISTRGLPGIRPGYRIDRPELNLSFYVERVSHTWTYPGHLATQVGVSRGQPTAEDTVLDYFHPTPNINSNDSHRQNLGKIFDVGKDEGGKSYPFAGTFTGEVIKPKARSKESQILGALNEVVAGGESLLNKLEDS
jgi:hypothetical protein